jgi:tetratricopeptide (TPR) repeat protein
MGRNRAKSKKTLPKITESPAEKPTNGPTIPALLDKAQTLITQCDYDLARLFIRRILERSPTHADAREVLGVVQLETGEIDAAKKTFLSLLPPHPDAPSPPPVSAHLYLAQLSDDDPHSALQHYQSAIDIFMVQLKGKERAENTEHATGDEAELKNNIVRALIGMVEIWMDPSYDLCFDPVAEKTCEDLLNLALQTDAGNAEALQALASVRMSQQRPEEAKACLEKAWMSWKDLDLDNPLLPPIPTRLSLVKLFLELSLFTPALLVLQGVMASDDQEVEAWYLEGWCFFLMAEQAKETGGKLDDLTWEELAKDSKDCLETCQVLHTNEEHPDVPLLEHVRELIGKLETLGIMPSLPEEGDSGVLDWEDVEDSEGEDGDVEMS